MNTPALNCKFDTIPASFVTFINRTTVICGTPPIADLSLNYTVSLTLNGYEYIYAMNPATGYAYSLVFTAPITVVSIVPNLAFDTAENV
jgi:hypothetical protein